VGVQGLHGITENWMKSEFTFPVGEWGQMGNQYTDLQRWPSRAKTGENLPQAAMGMRWGEKRTKALGEGQKVGLGETNRGTTLTKKAGDLRTIGGGKRGGYQTSRIPWNGATRKKANLSMLSVFPLFVPNTRR